MTGGILSVSDFSRLMKKSVEGAFSTVSVRGEIADIHTSYSGHTYFRLTDKTAGVRCVVFSNRKKILQHELTEGTVFIVFGTVSYYEKRGDVSLIVNLVLPAGEGAEALRLKLLREKLGREGLFHEKHKKQLPAVTEHIGVVTAEGGAAIHDIIRVARTRFPGVRITLYPSLVQGEAAEKTLVAGVSVLSNLPDVDVIIVGRGGGSSADLSVFNSELLAREVVASSKPVVSAVGHERDRTILDLCASVSVSTPSAAAERVTPEVREILNTVRSMTDNLQRTVIDRIRQNTITLDRLMLRMPGMEQVLSDRKHRLDLLVSDLTGKMTRRIAEQRHRFSELYAAFMPLNPTAPLDRGFALITQNGSIVKQKKTFHSRKPFTIRFRDGEVPITGGNNSAE